MRYFSKHTLTLSILTIMGIFFSTDIQACTGIKLVAKDSSIVHGRTLEFGIVVDSSIIFVPRGYDFVATTPQGNGLEYKSKYASVGAMVFNVPAMMDGLNEKGLAVGTFYFPGYADYVSLSTENQSKALSPIDFSNWILTQFATVEEVKQALSSIVIVPTIYKDWGDQTPPFHYIVYDKSGKSIAIEPREGKLLVYDNPLGVFTNSPDFNWHMTNLRNYINMSPFNVKPLKIDSLVLAPFGQGSGMVGLPGDFTPPSRFVRASIFTITATPSSNSNEAVLQAFHILNQFDIPIGAAGEKVDGVIHSDFTQITCVRDPQNLKYYFKTYNNQSIQVVDLKKFDFDSKAIKKASTEGKQSVLDITADLK